MNITENALSGLCGIFVVAAGFGLGVNGCSLASEPIEHTSDPFATRSVSPEDEPADVEFPTLPPENAGPVGETILRTTWGSTPIKYIMIGGKAIAEGDIIVDATSGDARSFTSIGRHWPNATVPYVIDASLPLPERVTEAIAHFEAKTKLRFVRRTVERDYVHFRSGSACVSSVGQQGGRQLIELTTSESASTVQAIGIDRTADPERVYFFYKRGFATEGAITQANWSGHFRYVTASGKLVSNVLHVAFASNGHLFAFYDDGTSSEGSYDDFASHAPARPYALARGKTPADVAAITIDDQDRAYAFYTDGTFSTGTVTNLAATTEAQPFRLAAGKPPTDLAYVAVGRDGAFHAFYRRMEADPSGGPPVARALEISSGTASQLATSGELKTTRFPGHCTTGATIHEIGHAIGLFHEHTRHDRDEHVKILWENIAPLASLSFTLDRQSRMFASDTGPYDLGSIMHYGPRSMSINGKETIVPIDGGTFIPQRDRLSPLDIAGIATMYP